MMKTAALAILLASAAYAQTAATSSAAGFRPLDSFGCLADGGSGLVSTNGTAVTWVAGLKFLPSWAGKPIIIGGIEYRVASVSGGTSLTLASSAGTLKSAEFLERHATDNGPCILAALTWSRDAGGVVSCANTNPDAQGFYGVETAENLYINRAIQFIGLGANSCWIVWTGSPGATTDMLWLWSTYDGKGTYYNRRTRIEGIHFSTFSNIEALIKLDQTAFFEMHRNWFDTMGTANPQPHPSHYLLLRAAEISDYTDNSFEYGAYVSVKAVNLMFPHRPDQVKGCPAGDADENGCYVTITQPIADTGGAAFTVSSCGFTGVSSSYNVLLVDGAFSAGRMTGGEVIRGTCDGAASTFRPTRVCSVAGSLHGDQPCRGDEATVATTHAAGAKAYYGFPVISEANFYSNAPFAGGYGTSDGSSCPTGGSVCGAALLIDGDGEVFGSSGNKYGGDNIMIAISHGSISLNGFDQFEANTPTGQAATALYQAAWFDCTTSAVNTVFYNFVDVEGGTLRIDQSTIGAGMRIGAAVYADTSYVRNSPLNGSITNLAAIDLCGATLSGHSLAAPCAVRGPLHVDPRSNRPQQAQAPSVTVEAIPYGTSDNANAAAVVRLVPAGAGGHTAYQLSDHIFLSGSGADADFQICLQLACPGGTVNTSGTTVTWAGGPDFLATWAGGSIILEGVTYQVRSVATSAPQKACSSSCTLTLNDSAGTHTGVSYGTSIASFSGAAGGQLRVPVIRPGQYSNLPGGRQRCPPGQHVSGVSLDSAGVLTATCN